MGRTETGQRGWRGPGGDAQGVSGPAEAGKRGSSAPLRREIGAVLGRRGGKVGRKLGHGREGGNGWL